MYVTTKCQKTNNYHNGNTNIYVNGWKNEQKIKINKNLDIQIIHIVFDIYYSLRKEVITVAKVRIISLHI